MAVSADEAGPAGPQGLPEPRGNPPKPRFGYFFGFSNTLEAQNFASRARVFVNFEKLHTPPNPVPTGPAGTHEFRGRNGPVPATRGPEFGNAGPKPT